MAYFVTGGTGLIGRFLVEDLLERDEPIYLLVRPSSEDKLESLQDRWEDSDDQLNPVYGDITDPDLISDEEDRGEVKDEVDTIYHLAAIYDMTVDEGTARSINVHGTSHVVQFANDMGEDVTLNYVSTIGVAGEYDGLFREDYFDEGQEFKNPYMKTKFEAERVVRDQANVETNIFRPGVVVGSSDTGYMDKINGPYYFFKLIQTVRDTLPRWFPMIGLEGEDVPIVPVDFVAAAIDRISHDTDPDESVFHLVDPDPPSLGETVDTLFQAAKGPTISMKIDRRLFNFLPSNLLGQVASLPMVQELLDRVAEAIGVPRNVLANMEIPADFDTKNTEKALEDHDLECPRFEDYAWKLWDYWERHLDPELHYSKSFRDRVEDKNVVVTGASSGIGKSFALKAGEAGADVMLLARSEDDLKEVRNEINETGDGTGHVYPCDLTEHETIDDIVESMIDEHGPVDILVNNAGHSIRRSASKSLERFHDYERTIDLNYFGSLRMIKNVLPEMVEQKFGQVINISTIGVLAHSPRFSAYVASKAALDAFSHSAAPEVMDKNVHFTTIYMPLVRTPMIEPTKIYDFFPALTTKEAADLIVEAVVDRPKRISTKLGTFAEVMHALTPTLTDSVLNLAYRLFPSTEAGDDGSPEELSPEGVAFAHLMKGIYW